MPRQTPVKKELFASTLKRMVLGVLVGIFGCLGLALAHPQPTSAATADTINFQAKLMTAGGAIAADGDYNVEFNLYSQAANGSSLWKEDRLNQNGTGVHVANGYLTVDLGSVNPFPSTINWNQDLWIGMTVRGTGSCSFGSCSPLDSEMTPRLKLTAVPYAMSAGNLSNVNGSIKSTLTFQGGTGGDQQFVLPDQGAAGIYNILTSANAGSFVQLQASTPGNPQTGSFNINGTGIAGVLQAGQANIIVPNAGKVGLTVQAAASQTGDLLQFKGSNGTSVLSGFDSSGSLFFKDQTSGYETKIAIQANSTAKNQTLYIPALSSGAVATICTTSGNCVGNGGAGDVFKGGQSGPLVIGTTDATDFTFLTANTAREVITGAGNVGIGISTANPAQLLSVGGTTGNFTVDTTGQIVTAGGIQAAGTGKFKVSASTGYVTVALSTDSTGATPVCQNGNGLLSSCATSGNGAAFVQGGNTFGAQGVLGTQDNYGLEIMTNNTSRITVDTAGNTNFNGNVAIGTTAVPAANLTIQATADTSPALALLNPDGTTAVEFRTGGSGKSNLYIGLNSGGNTTTASGNVSLGAQALQHTTTGGNNVAIGLTALGANTTGYDNVAIGKGSLGANQVGNYNFALGAYALRVSTGSENIGLGASSLWSNTSGSNNIAIGYSALYSNTTGSNNIALGYQADVGSGTLQNALAIGAYAEADSSNTLVLGCVNGTNGCTANTQVVIGSTTAPADTSILLSVGSANQFGVDTSGNVATSGTYNTNTFTNNTLTFGDAGNAANINSAAGQALNLTGNSDSLFSTTAGAIGIQGQTGAFLFTADNASAESGTVSIYTGNATTTGNSGDISILTGDATAGTAGSIYIDNGTSSTGVASIEIGTGDQAHDIQIGSSGSATQTVAIGSNSADSTTTLQGGAYSLSLSNSGVGISATSGFQGNIVLGTLNQNSTYTLPDPGSSGAATICLENSTDCGFALATDLGSYVQFAPATAQEDASTNSSIFINKTGASGNLIQLQAAGTDEFVVKNNGDSSITGKLGVGMATPGYQLDVAGDINTSGYYRQGGSIVINANNSSTLNSFFGVNAGNTTTTGIENTSVGAAALESNTTGGFNTAIGAGSLQANTTGTENVANGNFTLNANTTGGENTAAGAYALYKNTTGNKNSASGDGALAYNASGNYNTAAGYQAGFGVSGSSDVTGNALFGYEAGHSLQTGADYNTLLGYSAGSSLTTGAHNILIGDNIQAASATGSYQLNIGNAIYGDLSTGHIGIGTASPTELFSVGTSSQFGVDNSGNVTTSGTYNTNTFSSNELTFGGSTATTIEAASNQDLTVQTQGTGALTLQSGNGVVSLGTSTALTTAGALGISSGGALSLQTQAQTAASTNSADVTIASGNATGTTSNSGDITIDTGTATGVTGTIAIGTANASGITIGNSGITTVIAGTLQNATSSPTFQVNTSGNVTAVLGANTTNGALVCQNTTNKMLSGCDSSYEAPTATNFIQNQYSSAQTGNFFIQSADAGQVTAVIQGATGQTADILDIEAASGATKVLHDGSLAVTSGANTTFVVNNTTQNVGIGVAAPVAKLDVGTSSLVAGQFNQTGTSDILDLLSSGTPVATFDAQGNATINGTVKGGQVIVTGAKDQAQLIVKANSGQSAINPLVMLQSASGAELARISAPDNTDLYIGYLSGTQNSGANENTSLGTYGMYYNTTGQQNAALGYGALLSNTTGSNNTSTGAASLFYNTSGAHNTANGDGALYNNSTGSNNTAVGYATQQTNTTGSQNTNIGYYSNVGANNLQNSTAIGAYSYVSASNSLVLGCVAGVGACPTTTNIGIGNSAPAALFSVGSSSQFRVNMTGNIQAPTLDTVSGSLGIGGTNATSVIIGHAAGNIQTTVTGDLVVGSGNAGSGTAFRIQNSTGTSGLLLSADTTSNRRVTIGNTSPINLTDSGNGDLVVAGNTEVQGNIYIGNNSGSIKTTSAGGPLRYTGSARQTIKDTLTPEYAGAVMTGDGTSNVGTMTSDFCSGSSLRNIPATNNPCGATDQHNYYSWTTGQTTTQDYDIFTRWQVPSDFDPNQAPAVSFYGWGSTSGDSVLLTIYNAAGTACGSATISGTGAWSSASLSGVCNVNPGDVLTFDVHLTATTGNTARVGEITINYYSDF